MTQQAMLQWGAYAGSFLAVMALLRWAFCVARRAVSGLVTAVHRIEKMNELVAYELNPNGGGSIKDRIADTNTRVAETTQSIGDLNARFDMHLAANARDTASMWSAIEAIARSSPPEGDSIEDVS